MPRGQRRNERKKISGIAAAALERAERTAVFGKTKMCKFYILGLCAKGSDCCFAHDPSEMNPAPDLSCTKLCKTLINMGFCDNPNCKYAHAPEQVRPVPTAIAGESSPKGTLDLSSQISEPTGSPMSHLMMAARQGSCGYQSSTGQAVAVTLASVLRNEYTAPSDQNRSAERFSPYHAAYSAGTGTESISQESMTQGQHDSFQVSHALRPRDAPGHDQFLSSSRGADAAAKSMQAIDPWCQSTGEYKRQISNVSTEASSEGGLFMMSNQRSDDDCDKDESSDDQPASMSDLVVKNTFLEFVPEKDFVGLRSIRTAAGRLESLGEE